MFVEEGTENVCPARISGQNGKRTARFQELTGILRRCLSVAGIGRQLLCGNTQERTRRNRRTPDREGIGHIERKILQTMQQSIKRKEKGILRSGNQASATEFPDILGKPSGIFTGSFRAAGRLVQKDKGIFRNIGNGGSHRIQLREVAVAVSGDNAVPDTLGIGTQSGRQHSGVLRTAALFIAVCKNVQFTAENRKTAGGKRRQGFRCRKNPAVIQNIRASLGLNVKEGEGVYLVSPEFNTDRIPDRRRKEIKNPAAAGILAGTFHLFRAGVSAAQQSLFNRFRRNGTAVPDFKGCFLQVIPGDRPLYKTRNGSDVKTGGTFRQRPERCDAPLLRLTGSGFCGIECEFPHAQQIHRLIQHGAKVIGEVFSRCVIRTDYEQLFFGGFRQRGGKICPVYGRKTGNERRKTAAFPQEGEGGCFLVLQNLAE